MESTRIPASDDEAPPRSVPLDSVALARIMDEVRNGIDRQPAAYNRMHNRHNR